MLCIKDMFKGVRLRVEIAPKRGPGRPRKRPRLEEALAAQLPELAGELEVLKKRTGQKELEASQDGVEQLALLDQVEQLALEDGVEQLALQDGVEQLALQDGVEQLALLDEVEDDASSAGVDSVVRMSNLELQASGAFEIWRARKGEWSLGC